MRRRTFSGILLGTLVAGLGIACQPAATTGSTAPSTGNTAPAPEPTEVTLAFTPSSDPNALITQATAIAEYLSKETGYKVKPFITTDYTAVIEAMTSKKVDVAFFAPVAYVLANDQNKAEVAFKALRKNATSGVLEDSYFSTIIVPSSSTATKLSDLKGKRVAFVDPTSASGYIYPAALFLKNGVDPKKDLTATFAGGHDSAALAVYQGSADAAATFDGAAKQLLESKFPDIDSKVKTIAKTDPIPNDVIAFRSDFSATAKDKIKAAFKKMVADPTALTKDPRSGRDTPLLQIYRWDGIADAKDADFNPIREVAKGLGIPLKELAPK